MFIFSLARSSAEKSTSAIRRGLHIVDFFSSSALILPLCCVFMSFANSLVGFQPLILSPPPILSPYTANNSQKVAAVPGVNGCWSVKLQNRVVPTFREQTNTDTVGQNEAPRKSLLNFRREFISVSCRAP